jgi:erythromycin esterase-like protein
VALRILLILIFITEYQSLACAQRNPSEAPSSRDVRQSSAASPPSQTLVAMVREAARPITGTDRDYDSLIEQIGDARFVLLGEATHGTHEFYHERARITRRLIEEKNFNVVMLEADWSEAYRVNEFVRGSVAGSNQSAERALSVFTRFPQWMWRNTDFRDLVGWLRSHNNSRLSGSAGVRVYGMDLYNLSESIDAVIRYLGRVDSEAARRARRGYDCFYGFRQDPAAYGRAVADRQTRSCERSAQQQVDELQRRLTDSARRTNLEPDDELLSAYQNARVVKNGEAYYRTIYQGTSVSSWNLRDRHMVETIQGVVAYLDGLGRNQTKVIVWAHNSHLGDARMTEMGERGEVNVGQLVRQRYGRNSILVGFTTYAGEVRAAYEWGGASESRTLRPALTESYSALFHATGIPNFLLQFRDGGRLTEELAQPRLERAVGVIYLPRTERRSHYFRARLSRQFDAVIHLDTTSAVEPLR